MNKLIKKLLCFHKEWTKGKFYPYQESTVFTCKSCGKQKMFRAGNHPKMGIAKVTHEK